jgi:hypothetical protein
MVLTQQPAHVRRVYACVRLLVELITIYPEVRWSFSFAHTWPRALVLCFTFADCAGQRADARKQRSVDSLGEPLSFTLSLSLSLSFSLSLSLSTLQAQML